MHPLKSLPRVCRSAALQRFANLPHDVPQTAGSFEHCNCGIESIKSRAQSPRNHSADSWKVVQRLSVLDVVLLPGMKLSFVKICSQVGSAAWVMVLGLAFRTLLPGQCMCCPDTQSAGYWLSYNNCYLDIVCHITTVI